MESPGVSDIVKGRPASRDYENLRGIGQKMEIHRIEISPAQTRTTAAAERRPICSHTGIPAD